MNFVVRCLLPCRVLCVSVPLAALLPSVNGIFCSNQLMEIPVDCDCRTIPLIQHPRLVADGAHTMWPAPFGKPKKIYIDGYSTAAIEYHWCGAVNPNCKEAVMADNVELPSYRFAKVCVDRTMATTASGSYSRLLLLFIFDRESGFYMLQIFVPAALVVVISWVSFWISRDSAPSRTIIGVMTVLTETHLMTGTNRRLPPVAYVKAVDVYLGFCYLLVVLALIEYACVAYSKVSNTL
ncbi:unnamed protein product [Nippostrongylus brasiliensis]|uniref:Neur_chan_memb domain-containing protein n=1 Tax=Nippostrongylus brasiliensis TaxID=27835 RepID=A0A0N4YV62_NIPBR|nr:unnamed protein product [Nippostrongylus brasiliensis]